jgi:signal transduction histidine kinase
MFKQLNGWIAGIGILLTLSGAFLYQRDQALDDEALLRQIEAEIQADFLALVATVRSQVAQKIQPSDSPEFPAVQYLEYGNYGQLLHWSSQEFAPTPFTTSKQLKCGDSELLAEKKRVYYNVKFCEDTSVRFGLIPLKIIYPINNQYISSYCFLGRYQKSERITETITPANFQTRPVAQNLGINIHDDQHQFIFGLQIYDPTPFRYPIRLAVTILLTIGGILIFVAVFRQTKGLIPNWLREIILLVTVIGVRLLLLWQQLPYSYVNLPLFLASLLAFDNFTPTLGDFIINSLLAFGLAVRLRHKMPVFDLSETGKPIIILFHIGALIGIGLLINGYFRLMKQLATDSRVYLDLTNLFRLDQYSYLVLACVALLLIGIYLFIFWCCQNSTTANLSRQEQLILLGGLIIFGIIFGRWVENDSIGTTIIAFTLLVYSLHPHNIQVIERTGLLTPLLHTNLLASVLLLTGLATISSLALTQALENQELELLQNYAARVASPRDLIIELQFDAVVEDIQADKSLWRNDTILNPIDTIGQDLITRIVSNYLANPFKSYDIQVFTFDYWGRRLDSQWDQIPYPISPAMLRQAAYATLSSKLYLVPNRKIPYEKLYIGRFTVNSQLYGRVNLQIELRPKAIASGKIYPQLLLDQNLSHRNLLSAEYRYALYRNNQLVRQQEDANFPASFTSLEIDTVPIAEIGDETFMLTAESWRLVRKVGISQFLVVETNRKTNFDKLTAFTFLFYLYAFFFILYRLPQALQNILKQGIDLRKYSFSFRVQFILVLSSFLPPIILWALTVPLFGRFFTTDAQENLRSHLENTVAYLSAEPLLPENLAFARETGATRDLLHRVSSLLSCDLNLYDPSGKLFSTTRPRLYQTSLVSPYMNPSVLHQFRSGGVYRLIVSEKIGSLGYYSAYQPLISAKGLIRGYVNIPFLAQQTLLEAQMQKFLAYLLNVYVVLVLLLAGAGVLISRSLTQPLRLLHQKMENTAEHEDTEPIHWQSNDEFGLLMDSYNRMLIQLRESREKLRRTEREMGWRQMAKQVAHEIKNPLTPMKLSLQYLQRLIKQHEQLPEELSRRFTKTADTLLTQIDSLTGIANSFSEFASLPQPQPVQINLQNLLAEIQALYADSPEAEVYLNLSLAPVPLFVIADKTHLTRVIVNLVRNALQAMNQYGKVEIRLHLSPTNPAAVRIEVEDNGSGIPEELIGKIFQPSFSTKNSGSGLGLAISRQIVEQMNGKIWFSSTKNIGTVFYLEFPIHAAEQQPITTA